MRKFICWNIEIPESSKTGFIKWEADFLVRNGIVDSIQNVKQALYEREQAGSTLITEQLALPHFKVDEVQEAVIIFVQLAKPILDWEPGYSVDRFLCVVVPSADKKQDLEKLKNLFVLLARDGILEKLSLNSKEEVQTLINKMED